MRKKKILFIMHSLLGGGSEKVLLTILDNMNYSLFDVELLLIYNEGVYLQNVPKEVKVRYLYRQSLSFREKIDYYVFRKFGSYCGYKQLMRFTVRKHYDTIISFLQGYTLRFHSYVLDKADKNISWVHTDLLNNHHTVGHLFTEELEEKAYSMMNEIVFVSNDAKLQFEKLYPNNITKKEVILNPIDYDYISSYKREYNIDFGKICFNIVSVGRLGNEKGFDRVVRLAKNLKDNNYNFHITIIGEGEERDKLEGLIADYGLQNYVSLPGFLKPPYLKMAEADLFLMTSLAEGYPLVLCEAFCLGLPVVFTKVTGSIELIDNDMYGILVDHDDESIYQGVKRMIDNEQLRLHYHEMSLERAEMFNIEKTMQEVYNVL